jgi:hypothetical protein
MKKTRLLEIIREEIAGALNEIGQSREEMNATKLSIEAAKAKISAAQKELQQLQKTGVSEAELEEDQLNEMAYDIIIAQPNELAKLQDKIKDSTKKGEIKLCDFGISGVMSNSLCQTKEKGCRPYMAVCMNTFLILP